MFRQTLVIFSIFLLSVGMIAYWDHVRLRHTDKRAYQHFVKESCAQKARHALENHPATQHRTEVQKDFWIIQNHERQHIRIKSRQSELILHERRGKLEAVEKLQGIECYLQEFETKPTSIVQKQSNPEQQVRYLQAHDGTYFYPSHHFIAQTVTLHFFHLPGHALPESIDPALAFFSGTATEASFSACGKSPTFTAEHLHATFDPSRGLQ